MYITMFSYHVAAAFLLVKSDYDYDVNIEQSIDIYFIAGMIHPASILLKSIRNNFSGLSVLT